MDNLSFLKQIIMSIDEYWIVAKKNEYSTIARSGRDKDSIILTVIPYYITRGVPENEILLSQIEKLRNSDLMNIHINYAYAPFQSGMTYYNIYAGFPITCDVKEFMVKALELKSDSIYDYQNLIQSIENNKLKELQ